ncbi:lipoprotein [Leptospira ryugenii]|uniref:Lipoprotein n=1 Tax=Leptospira ryugenii TaxID=1917863 RepID=A0A2P2DY07_9LEPT|nr:Cys-rich protein [Leptospira ryugenii]GBF49503.1 lipoprotein [Leptospira ryugenii]
MKQTITASLGLLLALSVLPLSAADFPKCKEACDKYYSCTLSANPNATEEQKSMVRKGCDFNCNRPKYYNKIAGCLSQGSDCKAFSSCIIKEMQAK